MHGDGFLRANAGLATAVLGGPTFPITECNKGNKGNKGNEKLIAKHLRIFHILS